MERNEIDAALAAAVEEVLETMCFTTVLASGEGAGAAAGEEAGGARAITAALRFHGSPSGGFRLTVALHAARAVAAAFLGREEGEVSDSQSEEVVCELTNMICGSMLSRLEREATFQITHPEVTPAGGARGFEDAISRRWFDLGDGVLSACFELNEAV